MSPVKIAFTAVTIAAAVVRHPLVRAGIRAAPLLVTPRMREAARDATLDTAFRAGALARKIARRG